jgi:protein involved in polysaccharide export with SLBB domain
MISIFGKLQQSQGRWRSLVSCARAMAMSVILLAPSIDLATAQPPAPQTYRIMAGDKIGVTVFGQPDVSGESTVDQGGNIDCL